MSETAERDNEPFVRIYDRVVRRFWASAGVITEDEFRVMVEAEGLNYPGNRPIPPQQRAGETADQFRERLAREGSDPWLPRHLREQRSAQG
jgi:hypothetical protein